MLMNSKILSSILIVLFIILMTAMFWYYTNQVEGFDDSQKLLESVVNTATESAEQPDTPPSDVEVVNYYKALLTYISSDHSKGLRIVYDLNNRIYGSAQKVPDNFDPREVIKGFKNPLAVNPRI